MSWVPAGAEETDEDDFLDDYYDNSNTNACHSTERTDPSVSVSVIKEELKPKPNSLIDANGSPNGIVLGDIRMAVINGNLDYLREIIETQSDNQFFVDTILMAGWTPLMYASNCGHKLIVNYLLERGADPNYHLDNFTPLMAVCVGNAKEEDLIECALYLINCGANVNAVDNYGNSPLIYAAKTGKSGLTLKLIENKADINRSNNDGWNALHWAVREGYGKVVEKLLNNGIDVTVKTNCSQSAAEIALSKGHQIIKEILENIGQPVDADTNGLENEEIHQNRRLTEEEINALNSYVKPLIEIKCREKSESKTRVPNFEQLAEFLSHTNYEHLIPEFEKHNFGYHDLVTNTEEVLRQIGVEDISTIRKISSHIILIHKQDWKKETLKDLDLDTSVTCPDILLILSNISSHLSRIDETILFLKNKVTKNPDILSDYSDVCSKNKIFTEALQSLINTRSLFTDLQTLKDTIKSIEDLSEPQTPDVLSIPFTLEDELNIPVKKSKYSKSLVFSLVSVSAVTLLAIKYGNINRENLLTFVIQWIGRP